MAQILYEPSSVRGDFGILYLTEGSPCNLPFLFRIYYKNALGEKQEYHIAETDIIDFVIKRKIDLITPIIHKRYTKVINNVAVLSLSKQDMKLLRAKKYILTAKLLYGDGSSPKILIKQLPIIIQEVV